MDELIALRALAALAQESRLAVFRLLVRTGPDGMAAGEIARALDVPHNTMSSHLSILSAAGLLTARREGRSIIYAIDFAGVRRLLTFLMQDCCNSRPEICAPLIAQVAPECCDPA
jgi:DNA-binding transcriptional ArsR family regulator